MTATPRFPYADLVAAIRDSLSGEGLPPDIVDTEAALIVESDLQGVPSHGVRMVPNLIAGIRDGRVNLASVPASPGTRATGAGPTPMRRSPHGQG